MGEAFRSASGGLRVGVDGFNLAMGRGTGVATYARNLTHALKALGTEVDVLYGLDVPRHAPAQVRESLFFAALGEGRSGGEAPTRTTVRRLVRRAFLSPMRRRLVEIPVEGRVVSDALADRLPAYDRLFSLPSLFYVAARYFRRYGRFMTVEVPDPPALMHWTYPLPLRLHGARNLYTIHDLVPLRLPFASLEDRIYHDRLIRTCLAVADHVCTVSETSRRDIIDLFAADPARVTNTYQAVGPSPDLEALEGATLADRIGRLFDLEAGGYFLFFGAIEPKKNIGRLIEAYLAAGVDTPLVIAGPRAWKSEGELRLLDGAHGVRLAGAARIRLIDYLPRDHLMLLAKGAKAVLFPSLYEGFGLPVVEAMALGTPVMTSTGGALPEISAGCALEVDPYDVAAMTRGLLQLDRDGDLRRRLSEAGPVRAQHFSPAAYQARLRTLHDAVLRQPRPRPAVHSLPQTLVVPGAAR